MGRMVDAVNTGDRDKMLDALLLKIAETLDGTDSGRDVGALAIKFVDVLDRREQGDGANPGKGKPNVKEVPQLEVIAKRRSERRKAAEA